MKAGFDAIPFFPESRQGSSFNDYLSRAIRGCIGFAQTYHWGVIAILGVATMLLELAEHLDIIELHSLFYYGEITLFTILLVAAGLFKSSSARTVKAEQEDALLEQKLLEQKYQGLQKEIARNLHDTLGQNISYLRMKLEYLADTGTEGKTNLDAELRHMTEVANESYDLMRGTLAALQVKASNGLYPLLAGHAQMVAERASIKVEINERGCPRSLSPNYLFQIFFIFREALSNIEKYAQASRVTVDIEWAESGLVLAIADNGCGFDINDLKQHNHYGLNFMRERTECLNGHFQINSVKGNGTTIVIRL